MNVLLYIDSFIAFLNITLVTSYYVVQVVQVNNSYTHAPRSLRILYTRRPKAVAPERSEGVTKGLRVYKIRRLRGVCV